jgi:alkylated DNA repair dioxygenase AlkB
MKQHQHQATLFDEVAEGPPVIDRAAFGKATDHPLDDQSGIIHVPGFLRGHQILLEELVTATQWEQRRRWMFNRMVDEPRLTAEYRDVQTAPPLVAEIVTVLSAFCKVFYDGIWMNWYRDHCDGTGRHADRPAKKVSTATVPVLSLGASRRFLIRPATGGPSTIFTPAGGDLLIMRGRCQRDWQHSVSKQKTPASARMSLNFTSTAQAAPAQSSP